MRLCITGSIEVDFLLSIRRMVRQVANAKKLDFL
jgi:hypothetical protein